MRPAFVIAQKDLRQRIRDRSAIVLAIVAPFGLAAILGSVLPADEDAIEPHTYAVVDQDGGEIAQTFVVDVLGSWDEDENVTLREAGSETEARRLASDGEVAAAFVIPTGFRVPLAPARQPRSRLLEAPIHR